jgi:hypothetical protein
MAKIWTCIRQTIERHGSAAAAARAALTAGRGEAQFRDWPLGLNLGQWLPI